MEEKLVPVPRSRRALAGREKAADGKSLPQKKFFRQRAHVNPLSFNDGFDYPTTVEDVDWTKHYPAFVPADGSEETAVSGGITRDVTFLDIGCGFGGLTVELARLFPDKLVLGMEIRSKVKEYVRLRIRAMREESGGKEYINASVMRTNAMKYLPNFFRKGQLQKIFICFPDPHFKAKNHRRRIVTQQLLNEYAYVLAPGGILYTITDVHDLSEWMTWHCEQHAAFERIPDETLVDDVVCKAVRESTEEGKKVARNGGSKYLAVFRRRDHEAAKATAAASPFFHPHNAQPSAPVLSRAQRLEVFQDWAEKKHKEDGEPKMSRKALKRAMRAKRKAAAKADSDDVGAGGGGATSAAAAPAAAAAPEGDTAPTVVVKKARVDEGGASAVAATDTPS